VILAFLICIPFLAGVAAWASDRWGPRWPRWVALTGLGVELLLACALCAGYAGRPIIGAQGPWIAQIHVPWIPQLGIGFSLAMDGLSLLMVVLTAFLGIASVICSWTEIEEKVGFFHFNVMTVLAGIIGVFLAMDLFLFYVFWEVMLVPMYFLIAIWGHENRIYAALKFFIFTQAGGLLMLAAILALYVVHGQETGVYTFNYFDLLSDPAGRSSVWIMLGFFVAFVVKLPAVPFHTWLPDAHTEAPTAGSVILAGLLLKTGGYGLIRFVAQLFPDAAVSIAPWAMFLGILSIIYGAVLAVAQSDLKRLIAYTSVSHLGFVLVGVFCWNHLGMQGAVMQMICHGVSTGALFILVGMVQERLHTRELGSMGGLWKAVPHMGGMAMVFALASLGLPGLGNFVGEFLVLAGTFHTAPVMAAIAAVGMLLAAIYALWMVRRAFFGPAAGDTQIPDLSGRESALLAVLTVAIIWLGVHPQPVLSTAAPALPLTRQTEQRTIASRESRIEAPVRPEAILHEVAPASPAKGELR
jgi:NADH-quinone oxidoreductase subunit M